MSKYAEIRAKITELQKQADEMYVTEKRAAIADIKDKIKTYGITADEIGLGKKTTAARAAGAKAGKSGAGKRTAPAKRKASFKAQTAQFVGPNGETWGGGRGKRPAWVNAIMAAGGDMEKYRV